MSALNKTSELKNYSEKIELLFDRRNKRQNTCISIRLKPKVLGRNLLQLIEVPEQKLLVGYGWKLRARMDWPFYPSQVGDLYLMDPDGKIILILFQKYYNVTPIATKLDYWDLNFRAENYSSFINRVLKKRTLISIIYPECLYKDPSYEETAEAAICKDLNIETCRLVFFPAEENFQKFYYCNITGWMHNKLYLGAGNLDLMHFYDEGIWLLQTAKFKPPTKDYRHDLFYFCGKSEDEEDVADVFMHGRGYEATHNGIKYSVMYIFLFGKLPSPTGIYFDYDSDDSD